APKAPLKLRPGTDDTATSLALLPPPELIAQAVKCELTAIHPLTGATMGALSPVRPCVVTPENDATPAPSRTHEDSVVRTPPHAPHALSQGSGTSPYHSASSERVQPVRSAAPPRDADDAPPSPGASQTSAETATHAVTHRNIRDNADSM